jgi:hypothetical protein
MRPGQTLNQILSDYYRVPEDGLGRICVAQPSGETGFFRFGPEAVCYGQCASGVSTNFENSELCDAFNSVRLTDAEVHLPFDPSQVVENLRRERYVKSLSSKEDRILDYPLIRNAYYFIRELLPISIRKYLQKLYFNDWRKRPFPNWPVDFTVDEIHERLLCLSMKAAGLQRVPFIWFWPQGASNCLIMTHDVETTTGRDFTPQLMDLDQSYGVKASYEVVPEKRYEVPEEYLQQIRRRGFEVNVHDLTHDGRLYEERKTFVEKAKKINEYAKKFGSSGFRAGVMYRNLDWFDAYEFSYDMSVPNVAHLDPQRGGCCTVFPYFVGRILEIPLTTSQDYSLIQILNDYSIDLWKKQLDLIRRRNGLMSFITHPDYLLRPRARKVYVSLLDYLRQLVSSENIWVALPKEVDRWWRARSKMELVKKGDDWEIQGLESERARVAFAVLKGDRLTYEVTDCENKG